MQTISHSDFVVGIFKKELKNRFLCEVNINGEDVVCYVPSSCRLSNFLELDGKEVLIVPTSTTKSRTKYALFAVPYKKNYIILNSSMANKAIEANIHSRRFHFFGRRKKVIKEHIVENYKTDLYLPESKTIVEVKSIISLEEAAIFPTVYSERSISQLKQLNELLKKEYKAFFIIVSLHPYIKEIQIDESTEFYKELIQCIDTGLVIKGFSCRLTGEGIIIDKQIPIKYK